MPSARTERPRRNVEDGVNVHGQVEVNVGDGVKVHVNVRHIKRVAPTYVEFVDDDNDTSTCGSS